MAKQKNNIVMRSTRGMVGKQIVFKRRAGKSYVAAPPEVNENRKPTERQLSARQKFMSSTIYAKAALTNTDLKKAYAKAAKRRQSAYNVAFTDAYTPPKVLGIISKSYLGVAGNIILVQAKDDFRVSSVLVSIHNSADELIEQGTAVAQPDGLNWSYEATQANASVAGTKITVTAIDLPGNEGSLEVIL